MQVEGGSHLEWEEENREKEGSFGLFDVYRVTRVSPRGERGSFVVVDAPDWVTIVPVVRGEGGRDCFLMVRQYRHGSQSVTLEFPAGVVEWEEEPEDAAKRELREETGRSPKEVIFLGSANPNPAFMCNTTFTYLARELGPQKKQSLDALEEVELEEIPVDEVIERMGTPPYDNTIMMGALAYYLRYAAAETARAEEPKA